ncbi:MAG TPA: DUF2934 domain-containing protein [Acetobacteraceae bacterium]|nr:DUF2934 domain-containing protein [Acetobacteraceae bacterium]
MSEAEQRIRERAYQLWHQAGCPAGRNEEFWFAARREIEGDVPPVGDRPGGAIDYPPGSQSVEEPPAAAEAPAPAEEQPRRPVRAAGAVASPGAKKAAASDETPPAGKQPGKPAPRPKRR